ncbi:MAG: hypothetical protein M1820_000341 [Bogoriella megaspora]|nr:MAG: hypothetical protein M1820_000341 [Bogoriella megaspora]
MPEYPRAQDHDASKGRVLWLPPYDRVVKSNKKRNQDVLKLTPDIDVMKNGNCCERNEDGFDHPVVILSRPTEEIVKCHILTSFKGESLESRLSPSSGLRERYVPIEPSSHPGATAKRAIPTLKYCWNVKPSKPGYVVLRKPIEVHWQDLEIWEEKDASLFFGSIVQFDEQDMMKLDTRLMEVCHYSLHGEQQFRGRETLPRMCTAMRYLCRENRSLQPEVAPWKYEYPFSKLSVCDCAEDNQKQRRKYVVEDLRALKSYKIPPDASFTSFWAVRAEIKGYSGSKIVDEQGAQGRKSGQRRTPPQINPSSPSEASSTRSPRSRWNSDQSQGTPGQRGSWSSGQHTQSSLQSSPASSRSSMESELEKPSNRVSLHLFSSPKQWSKSLKERHARAEDIFSQKS